MVLKPGLSDGDELNMYLQFYTLGSKVSREPEKREKKIE
jgi:hypothetical protein